MPFYRLKTGFVHIKGTKLPPGCYASVGVQTSDDKAMKACLALSGYQCDWGIGHGRTCDAHLCEAHALQVGKNRHYCPDHFQQHQVEAKQPGLFTSLVQP